VAGTLTSKVSFAITAGKVYQIAVDGFGGATGSIALNVNVIPTVPTAVSASDNTFADKIRVTWAAPANAAAYEVWRNTTNKSSSATKISTTDVVGMTYDDTTAATGKTYYYWIKAKNAGGTSGFSAADSGIRAVAPLTNDAFANATALSGTSVTLTASNVGATKETGEPNHGGNTGGHSVWWTWTAPTAGTVTIDTIGSNFDTLLGVYTGAAVNALTTIASNDDSPAGGTTTSKVTFTATAGTTYQIAIDGYGGASGNITMHLNLV
jgi:fibronectin type 3 domain-containing protein